MRTVVIFQKQNGGLQYCGFIHFPRIRADHATKFVHEHIELISPFLFAQISWFSKAVKHSTVSLPPSKALHEAITFLIELLPFRVILLVNVIVHRITGQEAHEYIKKKYYKFMKHRCYQCCYHCNISIIVGINIPERIFPI